MFGDLLLVAECVYNYKKYTDKTPFWVENLEKVKGEMKVGNKHKIDNMKEKEEILRYTSVEEI